MPQPLILAKSGLILKILPHIGATIVSLEKSNSGNILTSDPDNWDGKHKPEMNAFSGFKAYNGHTVWVGPQSEWWIKQDENKERKDTAAPWPPDPFLVYGEYAVSYKDESKAVLESPESSISGIKITKEVAINEDGSIYLNTTFTNVTNKPLCWDIWYNTRVDGYSKAFVPVKDVLDVRVAHVINKKSEEMLFNIRKNFFSYEPVPPVTKKERSSKAFIYPSSPWIAAFVGKQLLVISFEHHKCQQIHPEQALVEIYNHTEKNKKAALLELEYHSPYMQMNPGESIEAWEVWRVFDYNGLQDDDSMITFLDELVSKGDL